MSASGSAFEKGSGLASRLVTAGLLIPIALTSVVVGGRLFAGVIAAMTIFLIFEWTRMVDGAEFSRGFYALSTAAAGATYLAAGGMPLLALLTVFVGGGIATLLEWPKPSPQSWAAIGAAYLILPAVAVLWLRRDVPDGGFLTLLLFVAVWAADSAAFACGKAIGGPRLAPRISPKKTWAGAIGGVIAAGLSGLALAALLEPQLRGASLIYGFLIGAGAVLGDVTESWFKRRYGMKDSGGAFPGHGGVLDRLDGFLFAGLALAAAVLFRQHNG